MSTPHQLVPLIEVASPVERREDTIPGKTYRQIGVRLWGEGAYEREPVDGGQTKYKALSQVETDDIVVNKIWARNGSVAVVSEDLAGCYGSNEFPTFSPAKDSLLPRWFHWHTKTRDFWMQCDEKSRGTSGKNRIRPERFLEIKIPLPPLPEQRRIVARIEELAARIEEARELRRQAMEEAEAFFFSSVSSIQFKEAYWTTVESAILDRKGAVRSGPFGSQLHHDEFVDYGVAAIGTRDVRVNRFVLNSGWYVTPEKFEYLKRYQVFSGDVLATIVGASIGRFCVVPEDVPLAFTTKHIQALTLDQRVANPKFAAYLLNYNNRCRNSIFAQTEGSAQPSLNASKILATELPLPSLSEQNRIVTYLDYLQAKIDSLKQLQTETAAELGALLPSVLDRAFKGKL